MLWLLIPLILVNVGLIVLGCCFIIRGMIRIRHSDRMLERLKAEDDRIAGLMK